MVSQEPSLRVLIQHIDHTLAPPGPLDNASLPRVPIIRLFGVSSVGQKACVHIHQVYPYFFVEYNGLLNPEDVNQYIAKLFLSLNHAISLSMKRNPHAPNSQFIRAIMLVKGVHFYGFHSSYTPFLKILVANPSIVSRAVAILQSGTVMRTRFRTYESHLGYILQFMCDFGLYGCGWVNLAEIWQRGQGEDDDITFLPSAKRSPHFRQSRLPLEVDIASHQILNRHLLSPRDIHHKLAIPPPPLPVDPVVLSVRELWEDERRRRIANGLAPTPVLPVDPSENSRGKGGEWVSEARWWDELRKRIEKDAEEENADIVDQTDEEWVKSVMTAFESVEALWEAKWKTWRPVPRKENAYDTTHTRNGDSLESMAASESWISQHTTPKNMEIDVDETMLHTQEMSHLMHEGEEWEKGIEEEDVEDVEDADQFEFHVDDEQLDLLEERSYSPQHRTEEDREDIIGSLNDAPESQDSHEKNTFENAWVKLTRHKRSRTPSMSSDEDVTPTKLRRTFGEQIFTSDISPFIEDVATTQSPSLLRSSQRSSMRHSSPNKQDFKSPFTDLFTPDVDQAQSQSNNLPDIYPRVSRHFPKASFSISPSHPVFSVKSGSASFCYAIPPPSTAFLWSSAETCGIPTKMYRDPFYAAKCDAPDSPWEFAGLIYHLKGGDGLDTLEDWQATWETFPEPEDVLTASYMSGGWEYAGYPPSYKETMRWLSTNPVNYVEKKKMRSQIEAPTPVRSHQAEITTTGCPETTTREGHNMTLFSLETFAASRGSLLPDANIDKISAVFYSLENNDGHLPIQHHGIVAVKHEQLEPQRLRPFPMEIVPDELELINRIVDIVIDLDPDILVGWEVQSSSWGYLNARGCFYGFDIGDLVSRAPSIKHAGGSDQWNIRTTSTFKVTGRHVFNLWRIMRTELSLNTYTFENVVFHLLQRRVPRYNSSILTSWYNSSDPIHTSRMLQYFSDRTSMALEILATAEVITKTAEFARVFGVDFYSVISRGSQFKVESFMFRIAKPESLVFPSPNKQDVGKQNAAECMPLIMEPLSAFYNGPVVVLDFQSLYPSIMIAYNYCYSTCLGRITDFQGRNKIGVVDLQRQSGILKKLEDHITIAPNGIMYVNAGVRKGLLGRMLTELLDTRVMVKQSLKGVKSNKALQRILDARQLGLKYIANVTYGYTGATFSGRMPAVEIADSIVQSGRETLEKAIDVIENTTRWGAKVVYGDTDSLFIYLQGKTKEQAFKIGYDISDSITALNPAPVKLKFEKVYLPCILMAKKRYVGFKYESPDEPIPAFDAKGIETVRRDGIPAQQKMVEMCLKILFRTQDLSQVKEYCYRSWSKILRNKITIQDFIFAKEVKMGTYSDKGPPPPGVAVAAKRMVEDENDEPQYGERIPYVIIKSDPQTRLVDRAVPPEQLLDDRHFHLDASYYLSRVLIPPLERIFNLLGADVRNWFDEMPRSIKLADQDESLTMSPRKAQNELIDRLKIEEHFLTSQCLACDAPTAEGVCESCCMDPQRALPALLNRVKKGERKLLNAQLVCATCTANANAEPVHCINISCPWLFERKKAEQKIEALEDMQIMIDDFNFNFEVENSRCWDRGTADPGI
ncbi:hypothetical protein BJ138DRAFT_951686 [Hygrophoropsis aurantiaca]|uniref:Uncharacterized protein n=1 Tax=Hygrophoropsis aurantiaca TaxID=72124 RepID=A0ACB8ADL0_9AGAM|nr:hypothetical protein BJ138DRAFT_951686 [Hygrophoropsis aurantiaca]